jgi:ketosteroid isomerase-like protein
MMNSRILLCVGGLLCLAVSGWTLTDDQTKGIDTLVQKTLTSFTTGDPAVWALFTTQGSAAVMRTADGCVAAARAKIKTDEALAAKYKLPAGLAEVKEERKLQLAGEFIQGRVRLEREVNGEKEKWDLTLVAVQDGENRSWRYVALCACPVAKEPDTAAQQSVAQVLQAWEKALTEGNTAGLAAQLNADPLCLAVFTPDGQPWFFTDRDYIVSTLDGLVSMGTATASSMTELDTRADGPVASAVGKWHIEIPMFEPMDAGFTAVFIKTADKWLLVSLCAGPAERK